MPISESVLVSSPVASFTIYLPKGNNKMHIFWKLNSSFQQDSIDFIIEDTENSFIGIYLSGDTLGFQIQNTEFLYL